MKYIDKGKKSYRIIPRLWSLMKEHLACFYFILKSQASEFFTPLLLPFWIDLCMSLSLLFHHCVLNECETDNFLFSFTLIDWQVEKNYTQEIHLHLDLISMLSTELRANSLMGWDSYGPGEEVNTFFPSEGCGSMVAKRWMETERLYHVPHHSYPLVFTPVLIFSFQVGGQPVNYFY